MMLVHLLTLVVSVVGFGPNRECEDVVYLFVNPASGGHEASTFTKSGIDYYHFGEPGLTCHVFVTDIRTGEEGFKRLAVDSKQNACVTPQRPVRVVVAGGDGTVVWAMQEALEHETDMNKVAFGTVPYGTGNDLSRVLGWGDGNPSNIFDENMKVFRELVESWLHAEVKSFDLWEVAISVGKNGRIRKWKDSAKKIVRSGKRPMKNLVKLMSNYFSFGIESQIGMKFDEQRTGSRAINKSIYVLEGIKHMFARGITRIADSVGECYSKNRLVFTTDTNNQELPVLNGNPVSMIFLNINSFAGGCDIWADASAFGLENVESPKFAPMSFSDRKLEVLTYETLFEFGWEQVRRVHRFIPSFAKRIAQIQDEVTVSFEKDVNLFAQVDGEFYHLQSPKRISVKHKVQARVLSRKATNEYEFVARSKL
jgi:diacylglycerol kinase (ATP)